MLKSNGNFKLSKSAKRVMATEPNSEMRNHVKRLHIQGELAAAIQPKRERRPEGRVTNGPESVDLT
jgi:hypothetical protein